MQMFGQHQSAEAQAEMQENRQEFQYEQAKLNSQAQARDLAIQQALADAEREREMSTASKQILQEQGTAQAMGASAGVAGGSYDAILRDYYGNEAAYKEAARRNTQLGRMGAANAGDGIHNQLHGARPMGVIDPKLDLLAMGLGMAGSGMSGYYAAGGGKETP